jgi:hypothetical protein
MAQAISRDTRARTAGSTLSVRVPPLHNAIGVRLMSFADLARLFPAEAPRPSESLRCIFYNLLRPELVRSNSVPLSSDAFSQFVSPLHPSACSLFARDGDQMAG